MTDILEATLQQDTSWYLKISFANSKTLMQEEYKGKGKRNK